MFIVKLVLHCKFQVNSMVMEVIRKTLTWISLLASIGNLLGVTLDRYFVIFHPLRYTARSQKNMVFMILTAIWTIAFVLGILTAKFKFAKFIGQVYVLFLIIVVIIPLYCRILLVARRHARIIRVSFSHFQMTSRDKRTDFRETEVKHKVETNSLKTVGIIGTILVVSWFPNLILPFFYRAGFNGKEMLRAFQWANTLALCSSACNPPVYSWRDRRFRKALNTTYNKWKARRSISSDTGPQTQCI